jgi:hypothetical protein
MTLPILSGPTAAFLSRYGEAQPWISDLFQLPHGFSLRLLGIDGDADADALGPWRLTISGCFHSQVRALEPRLPPRETHEVRVLLLHHSFQPGRDWSPTSLLRRICPESRAALARCVADLGISVVLTGHHHYWYRVRLKDLKGMEGAGNAYEFRTGTTVLDVGETYQAQKDFDNAMSEVEDDPTGFREFNSLMRHTLCMEGSKLLWRCRRFVRFYPNGFGQSPYGPDWDLTMG